MNACRAGRSAALLLLLLAGCGDGGAGGGALLRPAGRSGLAGSGKTYGATVADFDGDGRADLLLSAHADSAVLRLGRGGLRFAPPGGAARLPAGLRDHHGSAACDFDGDGDWDAYVTAGADRGVGLGWSQLWVNDGALRFRDAAGGDPVLANPTGRARGALWTDLDGDGAVELLLLQYESAVRLLDPAPGRARDLTPRLPVPPTVDLWAPSRPPPPAEERGRAAWLHAAVAADLDGDGLTDVLACGRPGFSGLWLGARARGLRDATSEAGLRSALWPHVPLHGAAGDVDGDGDPDLLLVWRPDAQMRPQRGPAELWRNESRPGAPRFVAAGAASGLGVVDGDPACCLLADLDNDGALDAVVARRAAPASGGPAVLLLRGDGAGRFADATRAWGGGGPRGGRPESALAADLDGDGDLDLLLGCGGDEAPPRGGGFALYRNGSPAASGLTLALVPRAGPPHGLGAVVELTAGGRRLTRRVLCASTPHAASILPAHFGVGGASGPFAATVRWPSGRIEPVAVPAAGAGWLLVEGEGAARPAGASAGREGP